MQLFFNMTGRVAGYPKNGRQEKTAPGAKNGPKRQNPRGEYKSPVIYW
jgi:hypothetical protein